MTAFLLFSCFFSPLPFLIARALAFLLSFGAFSERFESLMGILFV